MAKKDNKATPAADAGGEDKVQVCAKREGYVKGKTANGKATLNNGDPVAVALAGISLDDTFTVAAAITGLSETVLKSGDGEKFKGYGHLNVGMQRMSLGNKIRGSIAKDDKAEKPKGLLAKLEKMTKPIHAAAEKAEKAAKAAAKEKTDAAKKVAA